MCRSLWFRKHQQKRHLPRNFIMYILLFQRVVIEFFLGVIYFPLWWYTAGVKKVLIGLFHWLQTANYKFAPGLWLKNLFVPMFGQTTWEGRITSVFIRFANVIVRTLLLVVWLVILILLFLCWMIVPLLITSMIISTILL